jgi:hypothetical protein
MSSAAITPVSSWGITRDSPSYFLNSLPRSHSLVMDASSPTKLQLAIESLRAKVDLAAEDARMAEERSLLRKKSIEALNTVELAAATVGRASTREKEKARLLKERERVIEEKEALDDDVSLRAQKPEVGEEDGKQQRGSDSVDHMKQSFERIMAETEKETKEFEATLVAARVARQTSSSFGLSETPASLDRADDVVVMRAESVSASRRVSESIDKDLPETPVATSKFALFSGSRFESFASSTDDRLLPSPIATFATEPFTWSSSRADPPEHIVEDSPINRMTSMVSKLVAQATQVLSATELDESAAIAANLAYEAEVASARASPARPIPPPRAPRSRTMSRSSSMERVSFG